MLFSKFQAAIVAALSGILPAFIWWLILTGVQWAINKSGGSSDWIGNYKLYVVASIWGWVFAWVYIIARRNNHVTR